MAERQPDEQKAGGPGEVLTAFLLLGLTAFGGPVAHLGYFRTAFVDRRQWLSETDYADLVALCQFLPGPASSQTGIAIGYRRAGYPGAFAAWLAFTAPSVLILIAFALGLAAFSGDLSGLLHGLRIAALAVVANATLSMARNLAPDTPRRLIALLAAAGASLVATPLVQPAVIVLSALAGLAVTPAPAPAGPAARARTPLLPALLIALFFILLVGLPWLAAASGNPALDLIDRFYRAGALVFGGGHVVLPLLDGAFVGPGLVSSGNFLAGYGAAQAVPGPLFSFAAYLGFVLETPLSGWPGAVLGITAIYLPSFLLVLGVLPFWPRLRALPLARRALSGANAGVVGLLLAALYRPVFTGAVATQADFAFALVAFAGLALLRLPAWLIVIASGLAGLAFAALT